MSVIALFFKFLPEIIELIKIAEKRMAEGATQDEIKRSLKRINEAFSCQNRAEGAKILSDEFNGFDK